MPDLPSTAKKHKLKPRRRRQPLAVVALAGAPVKRAPSVRQALIVSSTQLLHQGIASGELYFDEHGVLKVAQHLPAPAE